MRYIKDIPELEQHYGAPAPASLHKVAHHMMPLHRKWIAAARYCVISTAGATGTDGSPRGDADPVARVLDDHTLALPDWRGNNRLDTLRNIVEDGRISLMFFITGNTTVIRVNGQARLTADADLRAQFEKQGKHPATVIVVKIKELYLQCARAQMRGQLWDAPTPVDVPSFGDLLAEASNGDHGGPEYEADWATRSQKTMW